MRYVVMFLALVGAVVATLALQVHYSTATEVCSINEKWDCGIVNHSPYAVLGPVPVAAIGIGGYLLLAALALMGARRMLLGAAVVGLGFSLYLTHIEKDVLMVWCVYCVTSLGIISAITLLGLGWVASAMRAAASRGARDARG
jgi:vitamin-K-epoxide reductase (warfarin-sensitive)